MSFKLKYSTFPDVIWTTGFTHTLTKLVDLNSLIIHTFVEICRNVFVEY